MIPLYFSNINKEKKDHIISVVLSKLVKKDIEKFRSAGNKYRLINVRSSSYLK